MLGEDKQQNHIKCSVTTEEGKEANRGRKRVEDKMETEQSREQKTVTNMVEINPTVSAIIFTWFK